MGEVKEEVEESEYRKIKKLGIKECMGIINTQGYI